MAWSLRGCSSGMEVEVAQVKSRGRGRGVTLWGGGTALATALSPPLNPPEKEGLDAHRLSQWACVRVESRVE